MVYLAIKELALTAEDVIMVTASIMKDMQPNSEVIYRPNAIRALARIIDVSAIPSLPRPRAYEWVVEQTLRHSSSRPWRKV